MGLCCVVTWPRRTCPKFSVREGADVTVQGGFYDNALRAASVHGRKAIVALLLEKGADVNVRDSRFVSALQTASAHEHEAIVALLLEKGA
jgi:ankyrin repeat protein